MALSSACVRVSWLVVPDSLRPHGLYPSRLLCPWDSPGKHTGVGCHFFLQGIFPTQGSSPSLLHYRQILYRQSHQGNLITTQMSPMAQQLCPQLYASPLSPRLLCVPYTPKFRGSYMMVSARPSPHSLHVPSIHPPDFSLNATLLRCPSIQRMKSVTS